MCVCVWEVMCEMYMMCVSIDRGNQLVCWLRSPPPTCLHCWGASPCYRAALRGTQWKTQSWDPEGRGREEMEQHYTIICEGDPPPLKIKFNEKPNVFTWTWVSRFWPCFSFKKKKKKCFCLSVNIFRLQEKHVSASHQILTAADHQCRSGLSRETERGCSNTSLSKTFSLQSFVFQ